MPRRGGGGPGGAELFRPEPEALAASADLVVVDRGWPDQAKRPLPAWLFDASRRFRTAGLDYGDIRPAPSWCYDPQLRGFDLVLRSHFCDAFRYPKNVRPWAFGLTRRIIDATQQVTCEDNGKSRKIVWNFQHKEHPHDVRVWCERHLLPRLRGVIEVDHSIHRADDATDGYEAFMWQQTCGRHSDAYFRQIAGSLAVAAFGGWFTVAGGPLPQFEGGRGFRVARKLLRKLGRRGGAVAQWDSWRFWETLFAGVGAGANGVWPVSRCGCRSNRSTAATTSPSAHLPRRRRRSTHCGMPTGWPRLVRRAGRGRRSITPRSRPRCDC